jgi:SAM-dependent methyltransferase
VNKRWLSSVYSFAVYERDRWVAHQARSLPPGSKVLDVGAGPCLYRRLFAHCDYKTQDFMQYEGSAIGPLADKDMWRYGKIDYVCDATAIPVPDASFDAVLCTEVLEHVPEPIRVVNELSRILRKGGRLWLTAPLGCGLHQEPHHYYGGYTPYWYRRFLSEAGFEQINVIPNGGFFRHYGQESGRFSAWIDPRRVPGIARIVLAPVWLLTLPWFRLILPLMCHYLDRLDKHCAFCVGYHVTATKLS